MWSYRRISTAQRGKTLEDMKTYYTTKILPIIAYACPAWFSIDRHVRCTMPRAQLDTLERLQDQCLIQVAQTHQKTCRIRLRSELEILPLAMYLEGRALIFQARAIKDGSLDHLRRWRRTPHKYSPGKCYNRTWLRDLAKQHPYHVLEGKAEQLMDIARRNHTSIERTVKELSLLKVSKQWNEYRKKKPKWQQRQIPSLKGEWGKSFKYYKGLNRIQGTVLFRSRVGDLGLNKSLFQREVCSCVVRLEAS